MFSLTWSLGALINADGREKFDIFVKKILVEGVNEEEKNKLGLLDTVEPPTKKYAILYPEHGTIFNYKFITEKEQAEESADGAPAAEIKPEDVGNKYWEPWSLALSAVGPISKDALFNEIIVETIDTIRYTYLMDILVKNQKPILFVGPTGTGKSAYVTEYLLRKIDTTVFKPIIINFSAQTSSNTTQDIIMSKLS